MNFSLQRIRVKGFRGVRGQVTLDFSNVLPGLYFVRGENRESPRYGSNSAGKALSNSIVFDTPDGRRRWGDLRVGERVFGVDGKPTTITGVFPQGVRPLLKVVFDDGTFTAASEDHLWTVFTKKGTRGKPKQYLMTTKDLLTRGLRYNNGRVGGTRAWYLPPYEAVEYSANQQLVVDSYVLGMWLGNGGKNGGRITVNHLDSDVVDRLTSIDCRIKGERYSRSKPDKYYSVAGKKRGAITVSLFGLKSALRKLFLLELGSSERFIPFMYLYSSVECRLNLLRGLMDSDGYVSARRGSCSFSSTSKQLVLDVSQLIRSLGGTVNSPRRKIGKYTTAGGVLKICKETYSVSFFLSENPFFSKRKGSLVSFEHKHSRNLRYIESIVPQEPGECSCITVEAKNGLFLANEFIVTHNSTFFSESLIWALTGEVSKSRRTGSAVENKWASGTEVSVEFLLDGNRHLVSRTRSPNGLFVDGMQCEQHDVEKLLPTTEAVLRKTVIIDQFGEPFLRLRPEAKSQMFTDALDLDKWLRAADSASACADDAAKKAQSVKSAQEGCGRALAEARDQYEQARLLEEKFEAELEAKIVSVKTALRDARRAASDCRMALDDARSSGPSKDGVTALNDEKSNLRRLHAAARGSAAELVSAQRELASLTKRLSLYSGEVSTCPECGQSVNEEHVRRKHVELKRDIAAAKAVVADATEASESDSSAVTIAEKKIERLEREQKVALESLAKVAAAAEKSLAADRESNRLAGELIKLSDQENPHRRQCDGLEARIKKLRAEQKQLKATVERLEAEAEVAKFWVRGFREIRLEQIDAALLELEVAANRHAEALGLEDWRIAFSTERETKKGTISHGFTSSIYPPGEDEPISLDTYSGGGEANRWQHAVTFALSEVLLSRAGLSTDFEVIDEPTTHLSPEGIDDLLSCLSDRARELKRRIFLIDHNSLSSGSFDGVVTVLKTKDRGSYIEDGGMLPTSGRERVTLDAA